MAAGALLPEMFDMRVGAIPRFVSSFPLVLGKVALVDSLSPFIGRSLRGKDRVASATDREEDCVGPSSMADGMWAPR